MRAPAIVAAGGCSNFCPQMLLAVRPNTSLMVHSADEDQFFDKCTQILSSIDGVPSTITSASVDSRRFVREGTMQKLSPSGAWQERHFFLFSDLLMWVKPKLLSRRYTYKGQIWLDGALLVRTVGFFVRPLLS